MAEPMVWLPPERSKFRTFVVRHEGLITVIGAGLAFLGFFVKEGVRDTAKDLASSLQAANDKATLRIELDNMASVQAEQSAYIYSIHNNLSRTGVAIPEDLDVDEAHGRLEEELARAKLAAGEYFTASLWYEAIPHKTPHLLNLHNELKDSLPLDAYLIAPIKYEIQLIEKAAGDPSLTDDRRRKLVESSNRLIEDTGTQLTKQSDRVKSFTAAIIVEAVRQHEKEDRKLKVATFWSWVLFVVGWGLSLMAKLLKVSSLGGGGGD
jgi:hypothetical protein